MLGAKRSASMHEFGTAGSIVEGVSAEAVDVDEAGDNAWRVRRQMTIIDVSGTGGRRSGAMDAMAAVGDCCWPRRRCRPYSHERSMPDRYLPDLPDLPSLSPAAACPNMA